MVQQQQALDLRSLAALFPNGQIVADPVALMTYESDAGLDRGCPDAVVFPRSAADVVRVVQWAAAHGVPLVARGAGTGLSGGAVAERGGLIVQFSRMEALLELDEQGRTALVQPGLVNLLLDGLAKAQGLYYPPDPSSGRASTLGGNIAENAGGPHCFKYGVTTNYISGLEVVLADGRKLQLGGRAFDYPEYDLVGLLTGSEGTLGIVTQANLRLIRNPPAVQTLMAAFDTIEAAGVAVSAVIAHGLVPATLEMMDQRIMRIIEDFTHAGLPVEAGAGLIVEVDGYPQSVGPQIEEISTILRQHAARDLRIARNAAEREKIWYARKSAAGAMARLAPAFYLVDGTVPRSKLAITLAQVNQICAALDLRVGHVFHAGDGNLHPLILIENPADQDLVQRVIEAGRRIVELCVSYDGSLTGEHGVGIEKRDFMPLMYSPAELAAMRELKQVFDPANLLNPDKIFPPLSAAERDVATQPEQFPPAPVPPFAPATLLAPSSLAEAVEAVCACQAAGQSIRIRGGGTKSALLPSADITISTECLRGISVCALEDLYVTVGAGTPLAELQAELAAYRMWTPLLAPWAAATVGGIVASNFNAPLRMRYGGVRDLLLAATVVLPDGRTIRAGRPVVKNVAGYDLPRLMVGAHGTLGMLTAVTLKLAPLPRARASLVVPLRSAEEGCALGMRLLRVCLVASALLLCQGVAVAGVAAPYALIYTAEGYAEDVEAELKQVAALVQEQAGTGAVRIALAGSDLWASCLGDPAPDTLLRVGVAPRDLPKALSALLPVLDAATWIADLASGMLYLRGAPLVAVQAVAQAMGGYSIVLRAAPDASAASPVWGYTPQSLELMRAIKARWDAHGRFNPGAFLDL